MLLQKTKNILITTAKNLQRKIRKMPAFVATEHFQERMLQRFADEDLPRLERAIEKAFLKAVPGEKIKYTHPVYNVTVVGRKMGLNGFELISCWKREEDPK